MITMRYYNLNVCFTLMLPALRIEFFVCQRVRERTAYLHFSYYSIYEAGLNINVFILATLPTSRFETGTMMDECLRIPFCGGKKETKNYEYLSQTQFRHDEEFLKLVLYEYNRLCCIQSIFSPSHNDC